MSDAPSTKPYLIRAIHEWCSDNGFRPYIAVAVDASTQVPMEFVRGGEIVLNVSPEATNRLVIGNDRIEFEARFNRVARQVSVPIANVSAIYAAENGHGMAFEVPRAPAVPAPAPVAALAAVSEVEPAPTEAAPAPKRRTRSRKAVEAASPAAESPAVPAAPIALAPIPPAPESAAGPRAVPAPDPASTSGPASDSGRPPVDPSPSPPGPGSGGRPRLTRVK